MISADWSNRRTSLSLPWYDVKFLEPRRTTKKKGRNIKDRFLREKCLCPSKLIEERKWQKLNKITLKQKILSYAV